MLCAFTDVPTGTKLVLAFLSEQQFNPLEIGLTDTISIEHVLSQGSVPNLLNAYSKQLYNELNPNTLLDYVAKFLILRITSDKGRYASADLPTTARVYQEALSNITTYRYLLDRLPQVNTIFNQVLNSNAVRKFPTETKHKVRYKDRLALRGFITAVVLVFDHSHLEVIYKILKQQPFTPSDYRDPTLLRPTAATTGKSNHAIEGATKLLSMRLEKEYYNMSVCNLLRLAELYVDAPQDYPSSRSPSLTNHIKVATAHREIQDALNAYSIA